MGDRELESGAESDVRLEVPTGGAMIGKHRLRDLLLVAVSLTVGVPLFLGLYRGFDLFGLAAGLGVLIVFGLILLVAAAVHLVRLFAPELHRGARFLGSVVDQLAKLHPRLARLREKLMPISGLLARRSDSSTPGGLFLTSGVIVTAVLAWAFISLAIQVVSHGTITRFDVRVASLSASLHAGEPVPVSTFFTLIGGASFRIPLCAALFGVVWLRRPELRPLIAFVAVIAIAPLLGDAVKELVRRPRPPAGQVALPGSFSFPSGHTVASASAFSFLAYLAVRKVRRLSAQLVMVLLAAAAIIGVAYSRVVLGAHWTSDVIGGCLLGLAAAAASATWLDSRHREETPRRVLPALWPVLSGVIAILIVAVAIARASLSPMDAAPPTPLGLTRLAESSITPGVIARLPLYSETLTGRQMEPVGLVFAGSADQIEAAFAGAGWAKADPVNVRSILDIYAAAVDRKPYPSAPVTPSFLAGRPQDLAFERDISAGSVAERHHIRIWRTGYVLSDGTPIWVATASLDDRVEIKFPNVLPNHHIDPAIDIERDYIAGSLEQTGLVASEQSMEAVPPQYGTNAAGDVFFTYGKAVVVDLRTP